MALAYRTHTGLDFWLDQPMDELLFWAVAAAEVHEKGGYEID